MASRLRMPTCKHAKNIQRTRMEAMCIGDKGCMCYMCVCARYGKVKVYADMYCIANAEARNATNLKREAR